MITDEGKRVCDKEIWSRIKQMWCGCRKLAMINVKSEYVASGLDYCNKHKPVVHQAFQCPSCLGDGCKYCERTGVVYDEVATEFSPDN